MLLSFKYQMPPTGLCVSNPGPQLAVLFRETIEPLGQGPSLARIGHDGKTLKDMPTTKFNLKLSGPQRDKQAIRPGPITNNRISSYAFPAMVN